MKAKKEIKIVACPKVNTFLQGCRFKMHGDQLDREYYVEGPGVFQKIMRVKPDGSEQMEGWVNHPRCIDGVVAVDSSVFGNVHTHYFLIDGFDIIETKENH